MRRARNSAYWPRMTEDVKRVCSQCSICEMDSAALPTEKHLAHSIPQKPWEKVGIDLFRFKRKDFWLVADYLTDYFEVSTLQCTVATVVVDAIKEQQFSRWGIPVEHTYCGIRLQPKPTVPGMEDEGSHSNGDQQAVAQSTGWHVEYKSTPAGRNTKSENSRRITHHCRWDSQYWFKTCWLKRHSESWNVCRQAV